MDLTRVEMVFLRLVGLAELDNCDDDLLSGWVGSSLDDDDISACSVSR